MDVTSPINLDPPDTTNCRDIAPAHDALVVLCIMTAEHRHVNNKNTHHNPETRDAALSCGRNVTSDDKLTTVLIAKGSMAE